MKMSLCQMIAIVCILAVGFMTLSPFVLDTPATSYVYEIRAVIHKVVHSNGIYNHYLASIDREYKHHYDDRGSHQHGKPTVQVTIESVSCEMSPCYQCNRR